MIERIINFLAPDKRHQLMLAFNGEFDTIIDLPEGKFIGVNIAETPHLKIIEQKGAFVYGEKKDEVS